MEYDEDGSLAMARALGAIDRQRVERGGRNSSALDQSGACSVGDLNGSWYLQLTPRGPHSLLEVRGPLRIEVAPPKLRISGDVYVRKPLSNTPGVEILRPITERPRLFGKNWYPHLPTGEYSWYFRSLGVTYDAGELVFKFERHLWNSTTREFIGQENSGKDSGFMRFSCGRTLFKHPLLPQPTLRFAGIAHIGGETYDAVVTKTSPHYRGCAVEVDVMKSRAFPLTATTVAGTTIDFTSIFRTAGMDCAVTVDQTNLSSDDELTTPELHAALSGNRRPVTAESAWRLWLMVGSAQEDLYGLMFDDVEPFREGTCGFFDPSLPDDPFVAEHVRNKKLGEVPEAFLRTLVHEAGHAFNLFHPKSDVHSVPIGTTIMNQTGDVMGFATEADPYPGNITFAFDDHNRNSLIHSPDPQVAPGWKRFGWGHGSLSNGVAEPVDAAGFLQQGDAPSDLVLELRLPEVVFRGQFISAVFVLTNKGSEPRTVTTAINLSQGDLRLLVKPPHEELHDVRDVIIACGDRTRIVLAPGESRTGAAQVFYTSIGFTFRQTGRYQVSAELDPGDVSGNVVRSELATVVVRGPATPEEEEIAHLSMIPAVGRAYALGDFGSDDTARANLEVLAERFRHTENGIAANLTLANSHARALRDVRSGRTLRKADVARSSEHFSRGADAVPDFAQLVRVAVAVAAPTEAGAPILAMTDAYLGERSGQGSGDKPTGRTTAKRRSVSKASSGKKKASTATASTDTAKDVPPGAASLDASAGDGAAQAQTFLRDVRRSFAQRRGSTDK